MYYLAIRKRTSPPLLAPRLKIFKLKFTTPPGIEPRTRWTRGRHDTIWGSLASLGFKVKQSKLFKFFLYKFQDMYNNFKYGFFFNLFNFLKSNYGQNNLFIKKSICKIIIHALKLLQKIFECCTSKTNAHGTFWNLLIKN